MQERVIFDTDIGTDVDDILALAFLLGSPEVRIEGVTTVYGDVEIRRRMVEKIFRLREVADIPVRRGISQPLLGIEEIYWPGHEGVGLLDDSDDLREASPEHAVDFLVNTVRQHPGEITLLAVGPLTNVAAAIVREPSFATSLKRLMIMGGRIATHEARGHVAEHNIKCDPEAANIVFGSGAEIELVPLDVTLRAVIDSAGVTALREKGTAYHDALADQIARYPGFIDRGGNTFLHDPLAAMALVKPDLLTWRSLHVDVELTGRYTRAMTVAIEPDPGHQANVRVALDLDVEACQSFILERLSG